MVSKLVFSFAMKWSSRKPFEKLRPVATALVAQWDVVASRIVPARAFENGVWLGYANHGGEENGLTYLGGSRIVAPNGDEIAVAGQGQDFITAEIDTDRVHAAQTRLPYLRDVKRFEGTSLT